MKFDDRWAYVKIGRKKWQQTQSVEVDTPAHLEHYWSREHYPQIQVKGFYTSYRVGWCGELVVRFRDATTTFPRARVVYRYEDTVTTTEGKKTYTWAIFAAEVPKCGNFILTRKRSASTARSKRSSTASTAARSRSSASRKAGKRTRRRSTK